MNFFQRFFGHLSTVIKHRREVRRLCFKCGLYWQGLTHDLSKYSPTEFINGVKFFTGTRSPHLGERAQYGYSAAWLHHKRRNKHHAEYWQDIRPNGKTEPIDVPFIYLIEMICDRVAASKIYLKDKYHSGSAWEYYNTHRDENQFSNFTRERLESWLKYLRDAGEEEVFGQISDIVKSNHLNF